MKIDRKEFLKAADKYLQGGGFFELAAELIENFDKFKEAPPEGLCPTFYHTLSYEGDLKEHNFLLQFVTTVNRE